MLKVRGIMTTGLITISPEAEILQAAKVLLGNHINGFHTIPVLDEEKLVGIVGKEDILKTLISLEINME